jgi:hypothetical protein
MLKRFVKRINLNFKHTRSERSANNSYSNYHQRIKKIFTNVYPFKKLKK